MRCIAASLSNWRPGVWTRAVAVRKFRWLHYIYYTHMHSMHAWLYGMQMQWIHIRMWSWTAERCWRSKWFIFIESTESGISKKCSQNKKRRMKKKPDGKNPFHYNYVLIPLLQFRERVRYDKYNRYNRFKLWGYKSVRTPTLVYWTLFSRLREQWL